MKTKYSIILHSILLFCFLGLGFSTAHAQMTEGKTRFGLKAGIIGANLYDDANAENRDGRIGFNGGVFAKIPLGQSGFSLRPELMIASKGASYKRDSFLSSLKFAYIELPVSLEFNLSIFNLHAGMSASYLTNSKGEFKDEQGNPITFDKDGLRNIDLGWHIGTGIDFGNVGLQFRLSRGISDVKDDQSLKDIVGSLKNAAWSLTFAYGF